MYCTNQQPLQRGGAVPAPFGLGRNGCWPSRGSQLPRALPFIFSLCCPLNNHRRAAPSFLKIGRLFALFPILTHLPLSGFLDSLLWVLIAPTPGLAFSLLIPHTLAAASSFLSGRAYPFLNFLPPLFLRLIPTLIM